MPYANLGCIYRIVEVEIRVSRGYSEPYRIVDLTFSWGFADFLSGNYGVIWKIFAKDLMNIERFANYFTVSSIESRLGRKIVMECWDLW